MKVVYGLAGVLAAAAVCVAVLASVAADGLALWDGAGWYALVVLAFPAFVAWGAWKHGG